MSEMKNQEWQWIPFDGLLSEKPTCRCSSFEMAEKRRTAGQNTWLREGRDRFRSPWRLSMCLWLINYQPGQIVHQPLVQLFGFDSFYQDTILINHTHRWSIVQGLFKVTFRQSMPFECLRLFFLSSKIYVELKPGDNPIHLSTSISELTFTLIYSPDSIAPMTIRLGSISSSAQSSTTLENICKQFLFLTKLVRCTFDEILYKQLAYTRSVLFQIERKFHHFTAAEQEFSLDSTNQDIFKEIYRQISTTDLIEDPTVKLIVHSSVAPSKTFAYSQWSHFFSNFNPRSLSLCFSSIWSSVQECRGAEFSGSIQGSTDLVRGVSSDVTNREVGGKYRRGRRSLMVVLTRAESLFYLIGAYLHELGHLLGLDHGLGEKETIMSSSKDYIESGKHFLLGSPRVCSVVLNAHCSCYRVRRWPQLKVLLDRGIFRRPFWTFLLRIPMVYFVKPVSICNPHVDQVRQEQTNVILTEFLCTRYSLSMSAAIRSAQTERVPLQWSIPLRDRSLSTADGSAPSDTSDWEKAMRIVDVSVTSFYFPKTNPFFISTLLTIPDQSCFLLALYTQLESNASARITFTNILHRDLLEKWTIPS